MTSPALAIVPVVMSGGSGTRLWPLSTEDRPKQFHAIGATAPMIVETIKRVQGADGGVRYLPPMVVCNARHADLVDAQLAEAGLPAQLVALEPTGRNTAATAVISALAAQDLAPGALVLLLPADHLIADEAAFRAAIARAAPYARERIVTFGIEPTGPETGFGYIEAGAPLGPDMRVIARFTEKPDLDTAREFLAQGGYYWNAGIFLFDPALLLAEFAGSADIRDAAAAAYAKARRSGLRLRLPESFSAVRAEPIDTAVMQKTQKGAVAPCAIGWADVGSWAEVWRVSPQDGAGNAVSGPVALHEVSGSLVHADAIPVAVAGLQDVIVVATAEAVLVLPKSRAQDVKKLWELAKRG